ncbi:DsrE family protein [Oleidesulfovibrio sp.]|uniref:DsrE family protein n=1 Tax=Oleidesulfovibrio sp. TaxID=2909707 RepID=UPI003A884F7A
MSYSIVFHVDLFDDTRLGLALTNIDNYLNALSGKEFETVMVVNGPAVQLFKADGGAHAEQITRLQQRGVSFRLCANALRKFDIAEAALVPGCAVVPAGIVEIVELQQKGFAYVKP